MRYLGSKIKLLPQIESVIEKYNIKGKIFADLFAGTSCVGDFFKNKYTIISNDFMYYSYIMSKAKLSFSQKPTFEKFLNKYKCNNLYDWLNNRKYIPNDTFFVYNNYTPHSNRMFFTEKNGIKIDGIRQDIENLYNKKIVTENEYYYLLASLLESVTKVSNTSGTYEAFFKFWESRAEKDFVLEPLEMNEVKKIYNNEIFFQDTNKLVRELEGDIAYIDTPYTVTQYASAYHFLETLARYDYPKIKGTGGKRDRGSSNSLYARKNESKAQFEDLFRQIKFKHVIVSYSNQGLVPLNELIELAKLFAENNEVYVERFDYKEYQNHRSSNKENSKSLNEIILYFKKDLNINKSPLNYSGSKNTLVPMIIKELPYEVENFVDVMGGAFNVGVNIVATGSVYYNELNPKIYDIIRWLISDNKKNVIKNVEKYIKKYEMKKSDKESFDKLKKYYNENMQDYISLFILHMYAFQNMIRFNSSQEFNTPIGVAGYSNNMKNRINDFKVKSPKLYMSNLNYTKLKWENFSKKTVFYFDPPYLMTNATYNDGKRGCEGWTIREEELLLKTLLKLDQQGHKFMLSNVIEHNRKEHTLLLDWVKKHKFKIVDIGVSGWRYSKNEVIIKNF